MGRQTISVLSRTILAKRVSRSFRNRLALTTILAAAPFLGYGRQVYAACPAVAPFVCTGANLAPQAVNADDADVSTAPGFSVNTAGTALSITGDGHLQFTDVNASTINGGSVGLYMYSGGDTINPGAITINANSNITGSYGIKAYNHGSGSVTITFDGTATGTTDRGMEIFNSSAGQNLTITTGAQSSVTGGYDGIAAANEGSGDLEITINGNLTGDTHDGLYARNEGQNLTITTGEDSDVQAEHVGIGAVNNGSGDVSVTANGRVYAATDTGIFVYNSSSGGALNVTTGAQSYVSGDYHGIDAANEGSGDLTILSNGDVYGGTGAGIFTRNLGEGNLSVTANGNAYGFRAGIYAYNGGDAHDLTVTTGAQSVVKGFGQGIYAVNHGDGDLQVIADGYVESYESDGILARNYGAGDLKVTTGVTSAIYGYDNGINAQNIGTGDLDITANGFVTGYGDDGIKAENNGGLLKITTGSNSYVWGYDDGISATNNGSGDMDITANGLVVGYGNDGINVENSGVNLKITVGTGGSVYGYDDGISATNLGSGELSIAINGIVYGSYNNGIDADNSGNGTNLKVTTGAGSYVYGYNNGIAVFNHGRGDLDITANGEVIGSEIDGIYAFNTYSAGSYYGVNLKITTGAQSSVTGGETGIHGVNFGTGNLVITANGAVEGQDGEGIQAYNSKIGVDLTVTTGAGSVVKGTDDGIDAVQYGKGNLNVTVNGEATGEGGGGSNGIETGNYGLGVTNITVGAGGLAQGQGYGIFAHSANSQNIFIINNGLVQNLSGDTDGYAIGSNGGAVLITNNNTLIGTVTLDTTNAFNDTLNNTGLWNMADGVSDFGAGTNDVVNNSGTLRGADDGAVLETTRIINLETFRNPGLITLIDDGLQADLMLIDAPNGFEGQNGKLGVDGFLAPAPAGISDHLFIEGNASGVTNVVVNLTNPIGSAPNTVGIPVVTVSGTTAQGDFTPEGGVLNAGFFAWDVQLLPDNHTHVLITTGLGAGSYEFAAGITGAQDLWYQTTGTLLQRQADLRTLLAGMQVTPVADFTEPVEPTPVGRVTPGLWFKGVGSYIERDQDVANNAVTDRNQEIYGIFGGFDFGSENAGEAWLFGVFGGYVTSDLDFKSTNTEWDYEGPSVGAYATYLNEAFHADVTVKADFLDVDIDASDIAPAADNVDSDVFNLGGRIDAGYKIPIGDNVFIDPQATLAVLHTEVDDIGDVFGGSVDFEDETSVRGRLGLRLGHELTTSDQVIYTSDVTASVWQEFAGNNDVTITAPLTDPTDVSDDPGGTYGDVALGFSVQSPEGWSSFLRANYQFSDDYDAFAGNAGVRYAW